MPIDRRKYQRINAAIKMKYRFSPAQRIFQKVLSEDISAGGCKLALNQVFKKGDRLNIRLYFPYDKNPVRAVSEVVWCKNKTGGSKLPFEVGMHYLKIRPSDKERFVFLFCEMMVNFFITGKI